MEKSSQLGHQGWKAVPRRQDIEGAEWSSGVCRVASGRMCLGWEGGRQRQTLIKERSHHLRCSGSSRIVAGVRTWVGEAPRCQAGPRQRPLAIQAPPGHSIHTHTWPPVAYSTAGTHTRTAPRPELTDPQTRLLSWVSGSLLPDSCSKCDHQSCL